MKRLAASLAFAGAMAFAGNAAAWGGPGHQLVGSIADQLLNANARAHVQAILGVSLQVAAPWPDCVRQVSMFHGVIQWNPHAVTPHVCTVFATPTGIAEMVAYAKANWNQCTDDDPGRACHAKYHFADVPEADGHYDAHFPGTNNHDVVHTINAAVARLEGKTVKAPFKSLNDRQALFLLAHMVGDLHQPLHVGAVYLDPQGGRVDPPKPAPKPLQTQGGNLIMYTKSGVLHGAWDDIAANLGVDGAPFATEARALPSTPGDFHAWPAAWASDTVARSHVAAFAGLAFGPFGVVQPPPKEKDAWTIASKSDTYAADMRTEQRAQLLKGGRHLADLLNAIWPEQGATPHLATAPHPHA